MKRLYAATMVNVGIRAIALIALVPGLKKQ